MGTICPYCNIDVNESRIEAEDGCCPECGAFITVSSLFGNHDDDIFNETDDDIDLDLDDDELAALDDDDVVDVKGLVVEEEVEEDF
jgi:hypothetical protein